MESNRDFSDLLRAFSSAGVELLMQQRPPDQDRVDANNLRRQLGRERTK